MACSEIDVTPGFLAHTTGCTKRRSDHQWTRRWDGRIAGEIVVCGAQWRIYMTFQAYLDTIKEKTGKTPEDFRVLAEKKALLTDGVTAGPIVAWLQEDFGLGRGHAMAIVQTLRDATLPKVTTEDRLAQR